MLRRAGRLLFAVILACAATLAEAAPFAYITNRGSNNVSVIDTATNTVVATVAVGTSPNAFGLFIGPSAVPPPRVAPIPTLSQWGLLLLGIVIAGLSAARLPRRGL